MFMEHLILYTYCSRHEKPSSPTRIFFDYQPTPAPSAERSGQAVSVMVYVFPIERTSQKAIIGSAVIFSLLPVIAVVLRIVARSRLKHFSLDLSDWLIILACVSF